MNLNRIMAITLVQLKEYRQHCSKELLFFESELSKYCLPEQYTCCKKNVDYYKSEVKRLDKKIENYPF